MHPSLKPYAQSPSHEHRCNVCFSLTSRKLRIGLGTALDDGYIDAAILNYLVRQATGARIDNSQ